MDISHSTYVDLKGEYILYIGYIGELLSGISSHSIYLYTEDLSETTPLMPDILNPMLMSLILKNWRISPLTPNILKI